MRMGRGKISPQVIRGFMKNMDMIFSKRKRMSWAKTPGYTAKKAFTKMAAEAGLCKGAGFVYHKIRQGYVFTRAR